MEGAIRRRSIQLFVVTHIIYEYDSVKYNRYDGSPFMGIFRWRHYITNPPLYRLTSGYFWLLLVTYIMPLLLPY